MSIRHTVSTPPKRLATACLILSVCCLLALSALHAFADPLAVGTTAPNFSLEAATQTGTQSATVSLSDYKGKHHVIMVFYPKDNTPGCTLQLCALRDQTDALAKANVAVIAVNPASVSSHQQFAKDQQYPFALLSDEAKSVRDLYNVGHFLGFNTRTVFIIDKAGVIRYVKEGSPPPARLLDVINTFN